MSKVWFITGAGRGFGKEFTKAALGRGDKVAATARNTESLTDLVVDYGDAILPIALPIARTSSLRSSKRKTLSGASTSSSTMPATACSVRLRS